MTSRETIAVHRHKISHIEMYEVTADELDRLQYEEPQKGHQLSFALAALSSALAFGISLGTEGSKMGPKTLAVFVALPIIGFVFFLFFFFSWHGNLKQRGLLFQRIRKRQVGPLGEEGREIRPEELAELPSEDATGSPNSTADGGRPQAGQKE